MTKGTLVNAFACVLMLVGTGCQYLQPTPANDARAVKVATVTCTSFATALDVATANINRLSAQQVKEINEAAVRAQAVCGDSRTPTMTSVGQAALAQSYEVLMKYGFGLNQPQQPKAASTPASN